MTDHDPDELEAILRTQLPTREGNGRPSAETVATFAAGGVLVRFPTDELDGNGEPIVHEFELGPTAIIGAFDLPYPTDGGFDAA